IRCLFVHLDTHVIDHADNAIYLFGILNVIGQMVVDLSISQITPLLAENNQRLEPRTARITILDQDFNFLLFIFIFSHAFPQIPEACPINTERGGLRKTRNYTSKSMLFYRWFVTHGL